MSSGKRLISVLLFLLTNTSFPAEQLNMYIAQRSLLFMKITKATRYYKSSWFLPNRFSLQESKKVFYRFVSFTKYIF